MLGSKGKNVAIIAPSTTRRAYPLHLPHLPHPESGRIAVESYPMSSPPNDKRYDEQLLAQAPEVTKADLQGGYNPDILIAPRPPSSRVRSPDPDADVESAGSTPQPKEKYHPAEPKSFWKTRKGIIVITSLVILVAIILAAVLGGVLGSRNHGHGQNTPSAPDSGNATNGESQSMPAANSTSATTSIQPVSSNPAGSNSSLSGTGK